MRQRGTGLELVMDLHCAEYSIIAIQTALHCDVVVHNQSRLHALYYVVVLVQCASTVYYYIVLVHCTSTCLSTLD